MNGSDRIDLADASDIANALSSSRNEDNYATMRDMEPFTHHCSGPQAASSSYDGRFKFCKIHATMFCVNKLPSSKISKRKFLGLSLSAHSKQGYGNGKIFLLLVLSMYM